MVAQALHRVGLRSGHLELMSLGSVTLCLSTGLWPPTLWLIGDALHRCE